MCRPTLDHRLVLIFANLFRDIFSLGFGPFRWVCTSGDPADLAETDAIATAVLEEISSIVTERVRQQYSDNIRWIREAGKHKMVWLTDTHLCKVYNSK